MNIRHLRSCTANFPCRKSEGAMDWSGGSRPHIIYNPKTKKYIGWADTEVPGYSVASSSEPNRGYTDAPPATIPYANTSLPGTISGDIAVEAFGKHLTSLFLYRLKLIGNIRGQGLYRLVDARIQSITSRQYLASDLTVHVY
jgi:hypothetical protein